FNQEVHRMPMVCMAFSPDYKYMVTGCSSGLIAIWDLTTKKVKSTIPEAHSDVIKTLLITDDNTKIISFSKFEIKIWDLSTYKKLCEVSDSEDEYLSMAYDKNSENLVLSQGKDIIIHSIATLEEIERLEDAHNG